MRILHLSDIHLDRFGSPQAGGVNARESLRGLLNDLEPVADIDVIVISGDIADDGSLDAYLSVRDIVRDFALRRQAPVFYSTGSHDERRAFARALGSGHLRPDGRNHAQAMLTSPAGERAAVSLVGGYRFITLDSLVPGMGYGLLGGAQLAWLREVLSVPAPMGSVLVLHHPPIALDVEAQRALGLRNPDELADAIRGTDVRLILCGHFHLQLSGHLESVPVSVTPGVVGRVDLTAPTGTERAVRGASATLVEIGAHGGPLIHTLHARDPRAGETIYELDRQQVRTIVERLGPGARASHGV